MALKVYCERGAYRQELRALEEAGSIELVHFPYEGHNQRVLSQAIPSKVTAYSTYTTADSSLPIGAILESEKFPDIVRVLGKGREFDARQLDSAYKSGCAVFLTPDKARYRVKVGGA